MVKMKLLADDKVKMCKSGAGHITFAAEHVVLPKLTLPSTAGLVVPAHVRFAETHMSYITARMLSAV